MTYNVFGGTLSLTQSTITPPCVTLPCVTLRCVVCTVLPTIGSSRRASQDARTLSILRGDVLRSDVSDVIPPEPDSVRVYLCYDLEGDWCPNPSHCSKNYKLSVSSDDILSLFYQQILVYWPTGLTHLCCVTEIYKSTELCRR